ncbi:MAG: TetR/AcrR family transcriptional regulator [Propionibacteriaceae bacterium]|nr:TetR/AcrR family transcriptional regulator [Propionibacteriaceae bacterium]
MEQTLKQLLRRQGYGGVTIERVAAESGVAKTTIYRRWGTKAEMVFALVVHTGDDQPRIDTGSLRGDVEALAQRAVRLIADDLGGAVLPGLLAEMATDARLAEKLRQGFMEAARAELEAVVRRARDRGELGDTVEVSDFHAALLGIPYVQVHLFGQTDMERMACSLADQLMTLLAGSARQ